MAFCFIIYQGKINEIRGKGHAGGHKDTVGRTGCFKTSQLQLIQVCELLDYSFLLYALDYFWLFMNKGLVKFEKTSEDTH